MRSTKGTPQQGIYEHMVFFSGLAPELLNSGMHHNRQLLMQCASVHELNLVSTSGLNSSAWGMFEDQRACLLMGVMVFLLENCSGMFRGD